MSDLAKRLEDKLRTGDAHLGTLGLGYVGLPLSVEFATGGLRVTGFDLSPEKVAAVNRGESYIKDVPSDRLKALVDAKKLDASSDFNRLAECDAVIICVPTPLGKTKDPDLTMVVDAAKAIAERLKPGQLVVLESTTYPGTTEELILPILTAKGLEVGETFFLAFSPERVDPGNARFHTRNTPKIIGGMTETCTRVAKALYARAIETVIPVSSTQTAEMVKLLENTFRSVNIGLVNEVALMCDKMKIDVWEVIDAAKTKPFGFMPFYPGPGLGGHCIPIDPFYLSWKARQSGFEARFIELAGQVNGAMPHHVTRRVGEALNTKRKSVRGAKVLVLGIAYKADIDDVRESPSLDIIETLANEGAKVEYSDPFVPSLEHNGRRFKCRPLTPATLKAADCVVIATAHKMFDYGLVAKHAQTVVDCRNVLKGRRSRGVFRL